MYHPIQPGNTVIDILIKFTLIHLKKPHLLKNTKTISKTFKNIITNIKFTTVETDMEASSMK